MSATTSWSSANPPSAYRAEAWWKRCSAAMLTRAIASAGTTAGRPSTRLRPDPCAPRRLRRPHDPFPAGRLLLGAGRAGMPHEGAGSPVAVPPTLLEVAEHHEVATIDGDELPVAPAQRALRPPAVLDEPRLAHRDHLVTVDGQRAPARPHQDGGGPRDGEAARARAHGRALTARTA